MYFNKFSSGTILALLVMSGIVLLVPLAAPAHAATNAPPVVSRESTWAYGGGDNADFNFNITNPSSNPYAITQFTVILPTGWWDSGLDCSEYSSSSYAFDGCSVVNNIVTFTVSGGVSLLPGATQNIEVQSVLYPTGTYPITGTLQTNVQDASGANFYAGPSMTLTSFDPAAAGTLTGITTPFTAGSAPEAFTLDIGVANGGVPVFLNTDGGTGSISGSGIQCNFPGECWAYTSAAGKVSGTFTPSNIAGASGLFWDIGGGYYCDGSYYSDGDCWSWASGSSGVTTVAANPASVGYTLSGSAFPSVDYLPFGTGSAAGTTTGMSGGHTFTGAVLCVATQQSCTGASPANTAVALSVTDRFGNSLSFGGGGITFVGSQAITVQTASGGLFDLAGLPSTITCGVTAGFVCPVAGSSVNEPFNYYQGAPYGSAGVMTSTITGTYNSGTFSVSGSTGAIQTSTFATSGVFDQTDHSTVYGPTTPMAGKSTTFDLVLGIAQSNVPVTIAVCAHTSCGATTSGYSGTIAAASGVTNSTGVYSTSLAVDTKAGHVAVLNATVWSPINGTPTHKQIFGPSNTITTIAGPAAKFTVNVGTGPVSGPAPITNSIPGATVYVNVVTSDQYGNGVSNVGINQIGIAIAANPATLSASNVYIPTHCFETNGTSGNGCDAGYNSFGAIAWTLPATVGSTATISATGVLNGASTTSPVVTINIVSKTPLLSVFSPKPLNNVIYSNSVNLQFRGWANASLGYNGATTMSSLGWKVGSGSWQSTGLAGTNAQWSVIATLPAGLTSVWFNATDSVGNVVAPSTPWSILVDTSAPTITNVTPSGTSLNPGQLFTATIVDSEGDLNASSVTVWANGTAIAHSSVTVSGTNSLGNSVTYTVTAALPTGHWSVAVSASDLAGNAATGATISVSVTVAFGNSITFNTATAVYGTVGAYKGVTVSVTNSWSTAQTIVVFATLRSGSSIYVAQGTVTVGAGQTASVFCADLTAVPAGTYSVTFSAVTTSNAAVSAPTTAITVTAT